MVVKTLGNGGGRRGLWYFTANIGSSGISRRNVSTALVGGAAVKVTAPAAVNGRVVKLLHRGRGGHDLTLVEGVGVVTSAWR